MSENQEILEKMKSATDSSPAAPATPLVAFLDKPALPAGELFPPSVVASEKSPQSSPIVARLSRQDLRDLIAICSREIGYCGLSQDAGQRALALREKLTLIHAHGWQS